MPTDIEIAQSITMKPITTIAEQAGIPADDLEAYGHYKAKVALRLAQTSPNPDGKLVLVTAINPTPAGEGKSTVTVGLADALQAAGHKTMIALREPSLGPVMGLKGGATGGGHAQVVPMADINLHFNGDFHALTAAHNTLAALIDNSLHQGNPLNIDPRRLLWKRALDINDRALRHVTVGLGGPTSGVPREDGFDITVASELMAILTLATSLADLKARIARIVIGYTYAKQPVTVADLGVTGAIAALLKDALKPNLVQTLEQTPALVHGGPFANIAQGTNSILATKTALQLADIVVTEAGFGADLGGEKFLDVKVPLLGKTPDTIVVVATVRALKHHHPAGELAPGLANLQQHLQAMTRYGVPVIVAINRFTADTDADLAAVQAFVTAAGCQSYVVDVWGDGSRGGQQLAEAVATAVTASSSFCPLYAPTDTAETKMTKIVQTIYGGRAVQLTATAQQQLADCCAQGWGNLPVIMAKTPYSLSDDATCLGRPTDFVVTVREIIPKVGAGFLVALTGKVLTMPGLPATPAANGIDVSDDGVITGLF